jgi:hypothetical protein
MRNLAVGLGLQIRALRDDGSTVVAGPHRAEEGCPSFKVTEAKFTYVAVNDQGNKVIFDK